MGHIFLFNSTEITFIFIDSFFFGCYAIIGSQSIKWPFSLSSTSKKVFIENFRIKLLKNKIVGQREQRTI